MGQRHRRLVASLCCIWLLTVVELVRGQDAYVTEVRSRAAEGDAAAQYDLGLMYANGEVVPQDYGEAVRWYRRAADQGYATAQYSLGAMYANGEGVPQDYVTAHMWVNLAGAQGNENARELRDLLAEGMSAEQIAAAQRAAREWRPARR